jgi:hypothetical protein
VEEREREIQLLPHLALPAFVEANQLLLRVYNRPVDVLQG